MDVDEWLDRDDEDVEWDEDEWMDPDDRVYERSFLILSCGGSRGSYPAFVTWMSNVGIGGGRS